MNKLRYVSVLLMPPGLQRHPLPTRFCPQTYWNLIESVPPEKIRLTRFDHEIWEHMTSEFPEYFEDPKKLEVLDEDFMKDVKGKERWRNFIQV